jgi:hypothetical protein
MSGNVGTAIYNGLDDFNLFTSKISLWCAVILAGLLGVVGIASIASDSRYLGVKGIVGAVQCKPYGDTAVKNLSECKLGVSFQIDGVVYTKTFDTIASNAYQKDQLIDLKVNTSDYTDVHVDDASGWAVIVIAVILVGGAWLNLWLSRRFKIYSAGRGAGTLWGFLG